MAKSAYGSPRSRLPLFRFMSRVGRFLRSLAVLDRDGGATAVEYSLMIALIAIVMAMSVSLLGGRVQAAFDVVSDTIANSPASADGGGGSGAGSDGGGGAGGGGGSNGANNNGKGGGWGGGVGGGKGHN